MSAPGQDDTDKSHDPTPQKLQKAREKGDVPRSADLSVAAGYTGLLLALTITGAASAIELGTVFSVLLEQPDSLSFLMFQGPAATPVLGLMARTGYALAPWFIGPALAVLAVILAQRSMVFAPSKLVPKLSRISIPANARNKFGRRGVFEFAKSFVKLLIFSAVLGLFLKLRFPILQGALDTDARSAVLLLARLCMEFLMIAVLVSGAIGLADLVWQHAEYRNRNRMSHKEIRDEAKEAEGDPHMKQQRRQKAQEIALSQMTAKVAEADVLVVNPTHFAVALKWSRTAGSAPVCVAKGVDTIAAAMREAASRAGVPIHSDPPTARALYATVELGEEVRKEHYRAVAAAIRFAEQIRRRAKGQVH